MSRHADTPSGPGKPLAERRDAVAEQEELDEMQQDESADSQGDAIENARHADRNAHSNTDSDNRGGGRGGQS
ncbi:hypothetical protein [Piscinibacter koreensis]|uniref:Uncharacterized protein n=1 Tax=Piscinibacter koreensis TaxID=2742824 RepID=A0A7Y6TX29_9BURK|nr:hypothetical protein [Schlegelella koreensis]NUZ06635.1 hypothetical protein [Schlegelella koreensis]